MYFLLNLVTGVCLALVFRNAQSCHNINNVLVTIKDKRGKEFNKTVNSCLERKQFGDLTATEIYVREQNLQVLAVDSVRHLIHLRIISFWGCNLTRLEALAFRNVPELEIVQFSYGNLQEIPKDVFTQIPSLEILRIHNNKLDFIENGAFANLTNLRKIYGAHNKLEYWNREWFDGSTELIIMDFQFNKIRTIPRRAFSTMKKLKEIYFDYNDIEAIQEEAFIGIRKLEVLGLRKNKLKELDVNIFPNQIKIRTLLISANKLNYISTDVLNKISAATIQLDFNPWKCPCLDRINFWVFNNNGSLRSTQSCDTSNLPKCAYPLSFSQTCLEFVDNELTERYMNELRKLEKKIDGGCLE